MDKMPDFISIMYFVQLPRSVTLSKHS